MSRHATTDHVVPYAKTDHSCFSPVGSSPDEFGPKTSRGSVHELMDGYVQRDLVHSGKLVAGCGSVDVADFER